MLTPTKVQGSAGFCGVSLGQEVGAFVRTITKGLAIAFTARAPKIFLTFNNFHGIWALLSDNRIRHRILQKWVT
jgi:hypothetical protein